MSSEPTAGPVSYEPTLASVRRHPLPAWYDDAKLGIFLHWGLYSVPGWAPQTPDIQTMLREGHPAAFFRSNPYAEWYQNSLAISGSPTEQHHRETYGAGFDYLDFREPFDRQSAEADLDALAAVCRRSGARYVVLTTKHHDGFCLWPSEVAHPVRGSFRAERDLVGDLTDAVRTAGLRMGLYYSAGYDWSIDGRFIRTGADALLNTPAGPTYARYCDAQLHELIDRYRPSVLWNDIRYPADGDLWGVFAAYYDRVPDGVVNDRWVQQRVPGGRRGEQILRGVVRGVEAAWSAIPARYRQLRNPPVPHCDFTTPEYAQHDHVVAKKWESTRGVGHSFGANRNERPEDILTVGAAVRGFVDIVSKGGNLLIGIGPRPDGTIPVEQLPPVLGLGEWLEWFGDAVYGTRPWTIPAATTGDGTDVRFTRTDEALFATLLSAPAAREVELRAVDGTGVRRVTMARVDGIEWEERSGHLVVRVPERLPVAPAYSLRIEPVPARPL